MKGYEYQTAFYIWSWRWQDTIGFIDYGGDVVRIVLKDDHFDNWVEDGLE